MTGRTVEPADGLDARAQTKARAKLEWKDSWKLAITSTFGASVATISLYSFGLFFAPLEAEFGWSRSEISFGLTIYALINAPLAPFAGALMDKWGARRIAIPGLIIFACVFSSFSLVSGSPMMFWGIWAMIGLVSLLVKPTVWLLAVSSRFVAARGTAMAVTLSGTAIAAFLAPILAQYLIAEFGWRAAYVIIGMGWPGFGLILAYFFFYDARDRERVAVGADKAVAPVDTVRTGKTLKEALRDPAFIKVCVACCLVQVIIVGTTVHLVPMLTERGLTREAAAGTASMIGIAAGVAKIGTGWLFDRLKPGPIATVGMLMPGIPMAILAFADALPLTLAVPTALLLGIATGAELSVTAYLATQYVGLRSFGKNYGIIASIMAISAGIGPLVAATTYDLSGSYFPMLAWGAIASIIAGGLMMTLPPPPNWSDQAQKPLPT